jgi:hypothetical protein
LDSSGSGYKSVASCCEHGNEPSGCIKGTELFGELSNYRLLKMDYVAWAVNRVELGQIGLLVGDCEHGDVSSGFIAGN